MMALINTSQAYASLHVQCGDSVEIISRFSCMGNNYCVVRHDYNGLFVIGEHLLDVAPVTVPSAAVGYPYPVVAQKPDWTCGCGTVLHGDEAVCWRCGGKKK